MFCDAACVSGELWLVSLSRLGHLAQTTKDPPNSSRGSFLKKARGSVAFRGCSVISVDDTVTGCKLPSYSCGMPHRIVPLLGTARIAAYENYRPHYTVNQIGELYAWHASLASAVHEVLGYCEVIFRNAIDRGGLSQWNTTHRIAPHPQEWLLDPAPELKALIDPPPTKS